jgi:hypothetical protein
MKKKLNNLIATAATASLFSWGAMTLANTHTVAPVTNEASAEKFLYMVEANHSEFKFISGKTYQLTIPLKDIKNIVAFSDRPNRSSYTLSPDVFHQWIHSGSQSFDKIHPNLAISFCSSTLVGDAFTIAAYQLGTQKITYTLTRLNKNNTLPTHQIGPVSLFIDDMGLDYANFVYNR